MNFKAYARDPGHFHGIVHDNMLKFGTNMGVTIVNNVDIWIIYFLEPKLLFPSFKSKNGFFVKEVCEISYKIGSFYFS